MNLDVLATLLRGVPITLLLTIGGVVLGAVGGIPLLALRRSRFVAARFVGRAIIDLLRGIPLIVWLFIIVFGLGPYVQNMNIGVAAIIGIGLVSSAYLAEIYRGGLNAIHGGQFEASDALGMSRIDTMSRIIGPQVARLSIPAAATYGIGLLKDSAVVYIIGVQDIMYFANNQARNLADAIGPFLVAGSIYIVLSVVSGWGARSLDNVLRKRVAR